MKKHILLLTLASTLLLTSCATNIDIFSLKDEPYDKEGEQQGGESEGEGEGEGEGGEGEGEDTFAKYKVTSELWNDKIYNLGYFKGDYSFRIQGTFTQEEVVHNVILEIDHRSIHAESDGNELFYEYIEGDTYKYYYLENSVWKEQNVTVNLESFLVTGGFFALDYSMVTFDQEQLGYRRDQYLDINNQQVRNILYKFEDNVLKGFSSERVELIDEDENPIYTRYDYQVKNWGEVHISFPTTHESEAPIVTGALSLDNTRKPASFSDNFIFEAGGYRFRYVKAEDSGDTYHTRLKQGGYITNVDPLEHLSMVTVFFAAVEDGVALPTFKTSSRKITSPNQGDFHFQTNENISIRDNYFSIYSTIGDVLISSIELTFEDEPERNPVIDNDVVEIDFINDIHGYVDYYSTRRPGLLRLATELKENQDNNKDGTLLLSLGDQFEGTYESEETYGWLLNDVMNEIGFDAQIAGNHDFDWGIDGLEEYLANFNADTLGINVFDIITNERIEFLKGSKLVEKNGHKIGLIGSVGNCYNSIAEYQRGGYNFITYENHTNLIKEASTYLKTQGAEFIVLMVHGDTYNEPTGQYDESLSRDGYVDLVLNGHTHQEYAVKDDYDIYHVQAGSNSEAYGKVLLDFSTSEVSVAPSIVTYESYASNTPDSYSNMLFQLYDSSFLKGKQNDVLTNNARYISSYNGATEIPNVYNKYLAAEGNTLLEECSMTSEVAGSIFYLNMRSYISEGTVTYKEMFAAVPFKNPLAVASIKGSRLISMLSSSAYRVGLINSVLNESEIDNNKIYYVIADAFTYGYSYNNMELIACFSPMRLYENYPSIFYNLANEYRSYVYPHDIMEVAFLNGDFSA